MLGIENWKSRHGEAWFEKVAGEIAVWQMLRLDMRRIAPRLTVDICCRNGSLAAEIIKLGLETDGQGFCCEGVFGWGWESHPDKDVEGCQF